MTNREKKRELQITTTRRTSVMFSKKKILALTFVVFIAMSSLVSGQKSKGKWSELLNSESDFMKGFELGLFLRTKGDSIEDYGCSEQDISSPITNKFSLAISTMKNAILTGAAMLPPDPILTELLDFISDILDSFEYFVRVLVDMNEIDLYCRGMVFGLGGSKMLVRFANTFLDFRDENGESLPLFSGTEE